MGSTYSNVTVRGGDPARLRALVESEAPGSFLLDLGRDVVVYPPAVDDEGLAARLSEHAEVAVWCGVFTSDLVVLSIYVGGERTGRWRTPPDAAEDVSDGLDGPDDVDELPSPATVDLLDAPDVDAALDLLEGRATELFAQDAHHRLAVALGLPQESVNWGHRYLRHALGGPDDRPAFADDLAVIGEAALDPDPDREDDPPPVMAQFNDWGDHRAATSPRFAFGGASMGTSVPDRDGCVRMELVASFASVGSRVSDVHIGIQGPLVDEGLAELHWIVIRQHLVEQWVKVDGTGTMVHLADQAAVDNSVVPPPVSGGVSLRPSARDFSVDLVLRLRRAGAAGCFVTAQVPGVPESMGHWWLDLVVAGDPLAVSVADPFDEDPG